MKSVIEWRGSTGDVQDEQLQNSEDLNAKSYQLYKGNAIARAAIECKAKFVLGLGLTTKASINGTQLGLDREQTNTLNRKITDEWKLFSNSTFISESGEQNLAQIIRQSYITRNIYGNSYMVLSNRQRPDSNYLTTIQSINPTLLSNPNHQPISPTQIGGLELKNGFVKGYNFKLYDDLSHRANGQHNKWRYIEKYGKESGLQNVLHLFQSDIAGQYFGDGLLECVIDTLMRIDKYIDSTLKASDLAAKMFMTIESETGESLGPRSKQTEQKPHYETQGVEGLVLSPGETVTFNSPSQPVASFEMFSSQMFKVIAAATSIPLDLLINYFQTSYSGQIAAQLSFQKHIINERELINRQNIQPIYNRFIYELALSNRIPELRQYFSADDRQKHYFQKQNTQGAGQGAINPKMLVDAELSLIQEGLRTRQESVEMMSNGDESWDEKQAQIEYEQSIIKARETTNE